MQKVFYNKDTQVEILDISGVKTLEQIKFEFGDGDYVEATKEDAESYRVVNGQISTYDAKAEAQAVIDPLKEALKSAKDFGELKTALLNFLRIK